MLALGVSETQVGWLASALISMKFISTLLGGYVADRFGRKRVLVLFDILCWGIPMLLFAVAQNPWYFLAGQLLNGFVYIVLPSFECLFVEDVAAERRAAVFGTMEFLYASASLLAPIAGFMVGQWGIIPAGRLIMGTTCATVVGMAILRQFTLKETGMGQERMALVEGLRPYTIIQEYVSTIRTAVHNRVMRTFLLVRNLIIYLTDEDGLGLAKASIAWLPFISALVTMAMILLAAKRMQVTWTISNLIVGQMLWLLAASIFVLSPAQMLWLAIGWAAINAASVALFRPASQSYWANIVGDRERAQVFSASSALMALVALPAGPLAGYLYAFNPRTPFLLGIVIQVIVLGLLLTLRSFHCWFEAELC
jgi:MFS family permease